MSEFVQNILNGFSLLGVAGSAPKYQPLESRNFSRARSSLRSSWEVYSHNLSKSSRKALNGATKETRR